MQKIEIDEIYQLIKRKNEYETKKILLKQRNFSQNFAAPPLSITFEFSAPPLPCPPKKVLTNVSKR